MERSVIDDMPADRAVLFERETFPSLIGDGLYGVRVNGYWLDIGTPERYLRATRDILENGVETSVEPTPDAGLIAPSLVGEGCEIADDAAIGPGSSLGSRCTIGARSVVERSVLHDHVAVGPDVTVRDCIVGAGASIGDGSTLEQETIVGPSVSVPAGTRVRSGRLPDSQ
ncbi:MAG: NDP-sugar synthase [Solirubrobacterales bacterium]